MAHPSYPELLKSKGWVEASTLAFVEKAGVGASVYFNFRNAKGIHLTFAVFPVEAHIRFRVYDPQTAEVRWLQIKMDHETDAVISKIVARQEEILIHNFERSIQLVVKEATLRPGIKRKVTPHMLRHSYATHLLVPA